MNVDLCCTLRIILFNYPCHYTAPFKDRTAPCCRISDKLFCLLENPKIPHTRGMTWKQFLTILLYCFLVEIGVGGDDVDREYADDCVR